MGLAVVHRTALVESVVAQLERQLGDGAWSVGERLPAEHRLAEELGVGRSTVREAVRVLLSRGLVESRQGAGTFVRAREPRAEDLPARLRRAGVLEVYEVRHGLEVQAARLAAARRTEADVRRMDDALARRRRARAAGRPQAFVDADLDFHRAVVAAAGNPVLQELFDAFTAALRAALLDLVADPGYAEDTHALHVALGEAIRRGEPAAAAAATEAHLCGTEAALRRLAEDRG
ncbi:FadR/GntR family transcriptional regulator [Geodermatophilus sp. DSM 44513]|uniref:FadR/GntR family transcriptional regulator n=1 Tax=Geodermatophilus sp. DSM 44513 TaxID=1528104 RepID=UPI001286E109|nr:FCD domain-containing protein [Geodermatophilus sp. DSM 44513]WNV77215.1 FCD domain-containing protein [Geodermatophilus sp. DSM 44513]